MNKKKRNLLMKWEIIINYYYQNKISIYSSTLLILDPMDIM